MMVNRYFSGWWLFFVAGTFLLAACSPESGTPTHTPTLPARQENAPTPSAPPPASTATSTADPTADPEPTQATEPTQDRLFGINEITAQECGDPFRGVEIRFVTTYWEKTNFCKHSIEYHDILSGGPPPDGIPAIDQPQFESVAEADEWLGEAWPVMFFEHNGDARAYPLAILMWHEIVNDEVGGLPVTLTFCPLCNATIAFNRTLPDGTVLDFGTTGNLRNSDLIMYDRQTESWWQQFTGTAIVGEYTGTQLEFLPSLIIAWSDFKTNHPEGQVLSRETGFGRDYGRNPYVGYDSLENPFLYTGVVDGRLSAMERVVAVSLNGVDVAYPFSTLAEVGAANDDLNGTPVVVFWKGGVASALDASRFDDAREVGSTAVFLRTVADQVLTFRPDGDTFLDNETGSRWNIFGQAVDGPLAGAQLEQVVSAEHFWFAWAAFKLETIIWQP